jgi:acyl-CoA synthetase (AMP-forming)/AMP-acid ligase II
MILEETNNIACVLDSMATEHPERIAVFAPGRGPLLRRGGYRSYTYRELRREVDRIARGLRCLGLAPGTRVVASARPGFDLFCIIFALLKARIIPIAVDPAMGLSALKTCLAEAGPEAFIGPPIAHALRPVLGLRGKNVRTLVCVGGISQMNVKNGLTASIP